MQYKQAQKIFPQHLLREIQEYADGCLVYIPNKNGKRKPWGSKTNAKTEISERNENIRTEYRSGKSLRELNEKYFLSLDTLKKIVYSR